MSTRKVSFAPGEYYHIYNRGNSKQKIFLDRKDYDRFLKLVFLCNSQEDINFRDLLKSNDDVFSFDRGDALVDVGAFCLMPNHFHLLIKEKSDGNISLFMQKLATAYVMYFNKKYNRTGSLFEGKFKSEHIDSDQYLKYIFSYIYLNPVKIIDSKWKTMGISDKTSALNFCKQYKYSSFHEPGKNKVVEHIVNSNAFPKYFNSYQEQELEIFEWLDFSLGKT